MAWRFLNGFYEGMKQFGANIANAVNFVLLFFVYIFGIGITAVIAKIFGKHFLQLKKTGRYSYWDKIDTKEMKKGDFYRQF
jgi:uncharacterized protein YqhQ